jgi:hypothetical protein
VWSRNLKNEEAMDRVGPQLHEKEKKKVGCCNEDSKFSIRYKLIYLPLSRASGHCLGIFKAIKILYFPVKKYYLFRYLHPHSFFLYFVLDFKYPFLLSICLFVFQGVLRSQNKSEG